jgi:hypothetical protein
MYIKRFPETLLSTNISSSHLILVAESQWNHHLGRRFQSHAQNGGTCQVSATCLSACYHFHLEWDRRRHEVLCFPFHRFWVFVIYISLLGRNPACLAHHRVCFWTFVVLAYLLSSSVNLIGLRYSPDYGSSAAPGGVI